jgi:hypothetical protein
MKTSAIQTKPILNECLLEFLEAIEMGLDHKFKLKRVARSTEVVAYFTPKPIENELKRGLPLLYLAIRTYTREGTKTVGPRVEIGTRDLAKYGNLLKAAGPDWKEDNSEEYRSLDRGEATLVLERDLKMPPYNPKEFLQEGGIALEELTKKVQLGAKELKRLYNLN